MAGIKCDFWKGNPRVFFAMRCVFACLFFLAAASGCGDKNGQDKSDPAQGVKDSVIAYPASLSAESTPTEVATVLIQALDAGDQNTLRGLVAINHEVAAVEAIYNKYGRSSDRKPEDVVALTAAGWQASYLFCKKNETQIDRETINGDTAVVFANGKTPVDKPCTLKIKLIREEGVWKVRAGLDSLLQQ